MTAMLGHLWHTEKILTLEQAVAKAAELKAAGKKIVTVNGSFDLLHAGHLDFLGEAKAQGDVLFVGLNSDKSVREGKGPIRPFIPEAERAAMLAALSTVDFIAIVDAGYVEMPSIFIKAIKPSIHVNGSEYGSPETWVEWSAMKEVGVAGYVVARRPNLATSDIIKKIRES